MWRGTPFRLLHVRRAGVLFLCRRTRQTPVEFVFHFADIRRQAAAGFFNGVAQGLLHSFDTVAKVGVGFLRRFPHLRKLAFELAPQFG